MTLTAASIWVDADACPNVIKDILYRAAERTGVNVTLVANQPLTTPRIPSLRSIQVASGFDVADNEIVKRVAPGDLVVTADIPLAAEVIAKGGEAVNPRGERYSADTIRELILLCKRRFNGTVIWQPKNLLPYMPKLSSSGKATAPTVIPVDQADLLRPLRKQIEHRCVLSVI